MGLRLAVDISVQIRQDNIHDLRVSARLTEQRAATGIAERALAMLRRDENGKPVLAPQSG